MERLGEMARNEPETPSLQLAVLIDADNAQASKIEAILAEVARFGEATVKRLYGDFTTTSSSQWKKVLHKHAIKPVQQFAFTIGKNATDSMLIIDAMDLMHKKLYDGFCLVSSDSDFTSLAQRIREEGLTVVGFGEKKTPESFRKSCHRFVFTELLESPHLKKDDVPIKAKASVKKAAKMKSTSMDDTKTQKEHKPLPRAFLLQALEQASGDDGWANLGPFGAYLSKLEPDFDTRLYGFKKLSDLVKANTEIFQIEERKLAGSNGSVLYVRAKEHES